MESLDLDALIGKSLDNRFELKKLIGQGGYGAVFEAVQTSMQRRCAVKVLSFQTDDPKQVARFELEARVTCQLTHPNTIVVYEYGRDEELGVFFIAMEYLDGQSLTELANSRTLSIDETLYILGQIADSLDDAHTYDLVHRDIKPHNIMIVKRGHDELCVKVIDFGIAKTQEKGLSLTQTDTIIGTPEYMSTEQVLNKPLTGKSDQYALAVTAYYLLTGRTLFNCETALQIAVAHASEIPPAISTVTDRFVAAENFDSALLRALDKDPDSRFDTCRNFVDQLLKNKPAANPDSAELTLSKGAAPKLSTKSFAHAVAKTEVAAAQVVEKKSITPNEKVSTSSSLTLPPKPKKNTNIILLVVGLVIAVTLLSAFILFSNSGKNTVEISKLADNNEPEKVETTKATPIVEKKETPTEIDLPEKSEEVPVEKSGKKIVEKKIKEVPKPIEKIAVSKKVSDTLNTIKKETPEPKEPKKKSPKKIPKNIEKGTVKIFVTPWGDIYVDGKKKSSKTRYTTKLSVGMHTFSLKQKGVTKATKRLEVKAGESHRVRLNGG